MKKQEIIHPKFLPFKKEGGYKRITNKGFTLVELIVVITILAILGTIAFVSLQGYSANARDSVRTSDLSTMKSGLELFNLEAGSYPQPSETIIITYSGATAWLQGTFGETVKTNVDKLDKIPTDPLTDKQYVYSTTSTRNEYSIAGAFEGETLSYLNPSQPSLKLGKEQLQVQAGTKTANLKLTGTYNGKVLKVSTGSTTYILAMPSIMSSSGTTVEGITTNKTLAYEGYKNLPFQYTGAYNTEGEDNLNLVNSGSIVVYAGDLSILSDTTTTGINARKTLIENLQQAYNGTSISSIGEIAQILNTNTTDQTSTEYVGTNLVANDLGGSIKAVTIAPTVTYSNCIATTSSGYTIPQLNHGINNQQVTKSVANGTKTLEVTCENGVLTYGTETTNCENDYIVSNDTCILDNCTGTMPDNAELNGTQGTAAWSYNTSPGVCKYRCQDGYHTENGGTTCVSDTQSCVISNATASQTWNGSTWGTCTVTSCNSGYTQSGNVCNQTQWSGDATNGFTFTNTSFVVQYPTSCNNLLTNSVFQVGSSSPWNGTKFVDGVYWIDPDGATTTILPFKVYCEMTTGGGGWTMWYTSNNYYHLGDSTPTATVYGTNGYSRDLRTIPFTAVMYVNHSNADAKDYFTRDTAGNVVVSSNLGSGNSLNVSGNVYGLWTGHGGAYTGYSYQLIMGDKGWMQVGLMMSGYGSCWKAIGNWCNDTSTNYYRINGEGNGTTENSAYHGIAFRENGHWNLSTKLMSVGIR